jgi:ribosomal protein S18 acetylase RimI-like enzyme
VVFPFSKALKVIIAFYTGLPFCNHKISVRMKSHELVEIHPWTDAFYASHVQLALMSVSDQFPVNIRPVHPADDLNQIADLIETCFANHLDADGRDYIHFLRRLASNKIYQFSYQGNSSAPAPIEGFVWDESGKIVGNLSLIRFAKQEEPVFLIANVAVFPEYRRKGIARFLTKRALVEAKARHASAAWLHVRDDNPAAIELYRSLGFQEVARRSTWNLESLGNLKDVDNDIFSFSRRKRSDWSTQALWLEEIYPKILRWNLLLEEKKFAPNFFHELEQFLFSETMQHWSAFSKSELNGVLTWEPTARRADNLWLAADPRKENALIPSLIPFVLPHIYNNNKPFTINYPDGRGNAYFEEIGFIRQNTLIWMKISY